MATSNTLKIDENYLRENYNGQAGKPVLKGVFKRVSVLKAAEMEPSYRKIMDEVEACIKTELLQLKNLNKEFPTEYQQVKAAIEAEYAQPDRHYITMSYYRELCKSLNITDEADLRMAILGYLNEIGVLRYFKDSDISYHILNPKWLIDGSYSLIVSEQTASGNGVLTKKEAFEILKRSKKGFKFEEDEARFIFTTMKFYGLLHFDEAEQKVYIPLQFSSVQPVPLSDFYENGQHFYVAFQSDIPEDVMSYLIVKHFEEIGQRIFWRTGAVFEKDNVRVLVRIEDRAIHFYIQGQYHQAYFEQLRSTLHKKLRTLPGLGYDEMVDFEFGGKKIVAKYDDLLTVLREKWGDYRDYSTKTKIPENIIVEILGGYFSAKEIQQNVIQNHFHGNYYDQRYQQNLIVHQLNQLVQTTSNEADRKALEEVQAAIKALSQAKDTTQKKSIGQRILGKIKDLAEGTADDALKEKLKELFPEIIEKGIDLAKNLDTETIMQALGGIF